MSDAIIVNGCHRAIIEAELFKQAQMRMEKEKRCYTVKNTSSIRHCLSGLIRCPYCGSGLAYSSSQSPCFQCWRYAKGLHSGSASVSEKKVWNALNTSLEEKKLYAVLSTLNNPSVSEQEKREQLQKILKKITYNKADHTFQFYYL